MAARGDYDGLQEWFRITRDALPPGVSQRGLLELVPAGFGATNQAILREQKNINTRVQVLGITN